VLFMALGSVDAAELGSVDAAALGSLAAADLGSLDAAKNSEAPHFRRASDIELMRPVTARRSHRLHIFTTRTDAGAIVLHVEYCPEHDTKESVAALLERMESALSKLPEPPGSGLEADAASTTSLQSGTGLSDDDLQDLLEDYG